MDWILFGTNPSFIILLPVPLLVEVEGIHIEWTVFSFNRVNPLKIDQKIMQFLIYEVNNGD